MSDSTAPKATIVETTRGGPVTLAEGEVIGNVQLTCSGDVQLTAWEAWHLAQALAAHAWNGLMDVAQTGVLHRYAESTQTGPLFREPWATLSPQGAKNRS